MVITSAVIFINTTGFDAFDFTVMVFVCIPFLPEVSKTTSRFPLAPGGIGFLSYFETVHPHVVVAEEIIRFSVPLLSNVNVQLTFSPSATFPKSC